MLNFLEKYRWYILTSICLLVIYLITRLVNLTSLPIFTDEAIYLRWAQTAKNDANWRFISLTDGKQPLYIWMAMIAMKFIADPLIAGRLVSVGVGIFGMLFAGLIGYELFKDKKIGFLAAALYLVYPLTLFYDRFALMESLLGVTVLISVYLEILLVRHLRLDLSLILGLAMGAAMLTKSSGFYALYLAPLLFLLFDFAKKDWKKRLVKFILLFGLSTLLSQLYYSVLRLSPLFHMIIEKDGTFVYPIKEWLKHPFDFYVGNLKGMLDWLTHYTSWPLLLLVIIALFYSYRNFTKQRWFLFLWFLLPFNLAALFGKVLYPRYIVLPTLTLLILMASSLFEIERWIKNKRVLLLVMSVILLPSILFDYRILSDIKHAQLTYIDKGQYLNDWPSGWGVRESVEILRNEARKGKIAIFTDGTFGLMPYALELYLVYDENVFIKGLWPLSDEFPSEMKAKAKEMPTFFVGNQKQNIPSAWPLKLVGQWEKGSNKEKTLRLYRVENI